MIRICIVNVDATFEEVVVACFISLCLQGDRETFENYYRKQRKKQARLVLQPQANMVSNTLREPHSMCGSQLTHTPSPFGPHSRCS